MYPWLWFWAPRLEFPLSGNVVQDIEPVASLFSAPINLAAGNPRIEQKAFEVASYGQQLGWITEVLIEIAERVLPERGKDTESLQKLERIQAEIEKIKISVYDSELNDLERRIEVIRRRAAKSRTR